MSALSWLGKTKRSQWRPLRGISEHFTGLFRLTFISIARDGSLQSVLTLWPPPLFTLSLFFFFWGLTDLKVLLSAKLKSRFTLRRKVRVWWLNEEPPRSSLNNTFVKDAGKEIVLERGTVSLWSNNYRSSTNSLIVKRQSILEVAITTSQIPSMSDLVERGTCTKSHVYLTHHFIPVLQI